MLPQKYSINKKGLICPAISSKITFSKSTKNVWVKFITNKMTYSESESDFSFAINSVSDFDSASKSDSDTESDFSSVFMNLDICIFFILYLHSSK